MQCNQKQNTLLHIALFSLFVLFVKMQAITYFSKKTVKQHKTTIYVDRRF